MKGRFTDLERFYPHLPRTAPRCLRDLDPRLRIYRDRRLEIWYSPHGRGPGAPRLWILGITPGWQQVAIAYTEAARAMARGHPPAQAALCPKPAVGFAGSMRANLVGMLDELGVADALGMACASSLFGSELLRTGSVLKYPVFVNGRNYTGHGPSALAHPVLRQMVYEVFVEELRMLPYALVIPLGKGAESVLVHAIAEGWIDASRVLFGLPHPSGANGHRHRVFRANRSDLARTLDAWFSGREGGV